MGSDVSFAKLLIAKFAKVAELADALDLGSAFSGFRMCLKTL